MYKAASKSCKETCKCTSRLEQPSEHKIIEKSQLKTYSQGLHLHSKLTTNDRKICSTSAGEEECGRAKYKAKPTAHYLCSKQDYKIRHDRLAHKSDINWVVLFHSIGHLSSFTSWLRSSRWRLLCESSGCARSLVRALRMRTTSHCFTIVCSQSHIVGLKLISYLVSDTPGCAF